MSILIKNASGAKWERAIENSFSNEVELQELLYSSPELVEKDDEGIIVFTRESTLPGSGSTDLIGVSQSGDILLIETKLAKNTEIRRKVIGQILEYAAFLWGMSYESLNQIFVTREKKSLVELLSDRGADVDSESFRATVSSNLAAGKFDLLIVVDQINDELEKIISYISSFDDGPRLEALAVMVHTHGEVSVLVPQRFGQLKGSLGGGRTQDKVTVEAVLADAPNPEIRELMRATIQGWMKSGFEIAPGISGLSCKAEIGGKFQPLFWITRGAGFWRIEALCKSMLKRGVSAEEVKAYRTSLSQIAGFDPKMSMERDRPPAPFSKLSEKSVQTFLDVTASLVAKWRTTLQ